MSLCLTPAEIADLCAPLTQPSAQCARLRSMGFTVTKRPNGTPIVSRANFERVMGGRVDLAPVDDEAAARAFVVGGSKQNVLSFQNR